MKSIPFVSALLLACLSASVVADIEMRPRPTDEKDFPEYIQYLVDVAEPRSAEERALDSELQDKYRGASVVDVLFVGAPGFPAGLTPEIYEEAIHHSIDNRYTLLSATVSNGKPEDTPDIVAKRMKDTNVYWRAQSDRYMQVYTFDQIAMAKKQASSG